jgi:hypothetical protein
MNWKIFVRKWSWPSRSNILAFVIVVVIIIIIIIIIIINNTIILSSTCYFAFQTAQLLLQFTTSACCSINLSTNEKGAEGHMSPTNEGTQHRLQPRSYVHYSAP